MHECYCYNFYNVYMENIMQPENFRVLCQNITTVTTITTIKADSETVSSTFTRAFELFSKCHRGYNSNIVSDTDIQQIGIHTENKIHFHNISLILNSQNKTSPTSSSTIEFTFLMPPFSPKCISWRTTSSLGFRDGTLEQV